MKVYITRKIPEVGIKILGDSGYEVDVNPENRCLSKEELIASLCLKPYNALISLLTDSIDRVVLDACPSLKIISNYAVGYNNIDIVEANKRNIAVFNTPFSMDTVAFHTVTLILALSRRILEADSFVRKGLFKGFDPFLFLGTDLSGKTVGILGAGRIGFKVAQILSKGFDMNIIYNDISRNKILEDECGAVFYNDLNDFLSASDIVSIHTPLLDSTVHLINESNLKFMKKTAYLINTSRGKVVDEKALVSFLKAGDIAGAGLDVFENEPEIPPELVSLPNVILTPHTASSSLKTRDEMSKIVAQNVIDFFEGKNIKNKISTDR